MTTKQDKQEMLAPSAEDHLAAQATPSVGFERAGTTLSLLDGATFERAYKMAELMATANGLPGFFQRSPGTCMAAIEEGLRLGISPFVVARMSYQVQGGPLGYLGKFVVAMLNRSPEIDGRLTFEHVGPWDKIVGKFVMKESQRAKDQNGAAAKYAARNWDDSAEVGCAVIVRGKLARSGQVAELSLDMRQCHPRNSTLWASDPQQQICYVAARRWADRFVPEVLMGMSTDAELGEDGMVDITPGSQKAAAPAPTNRLQHFVEQHQPAPPEKPEQPQHPEPSDKPRGTTQVELCLPSAVAGDVPSIQTVPVAQAAQALIDAAQGQSEEWIAAARDANPWIRRHRYTNTALDAMEEVARAKAQRQQDQGEQIEQGEEYDRDTGELEV